MVRRKRNKENLPKVIKAINDLSGGNIEEQSSGEESNTEAIDFHRPSRIMSSRRMIRTRQELRSRSRVDRIIRGRPILRSNRSMSRVRRSMSRVRSRSRTRSRRRRRRRYSRDRQLERSIFRRRLLENRTSMNSGDWIMPVADMSDEDADEEFNIYLITVPAVGGTEFLYNPDNLNAIDYDVTDENNNIEQEQSGSENLENNTLNSDVKRAIYSIVNSNNLSHDTQKDNDVVVEGTSEQDGLKIVELPTNENNLNTLDCAKVSNLKEDMSDHSQNNNDTDTFNQKENKKKKLE